MQIARRPLDDLLDVIRVLLLVQGAILVATTIEAFFWSLAFPGAAGIPVLMSGAAALAIFVARARVRSDRRFARRTIYVVELVIAVTSLIDVALAVALRGTLPPVVALLTGLVLPVTVIALLRRSTRQSVAQPAQVFAGVEVTM